MKGKMEICLISSDEMKQLYPCYGSLDQISKSNIVKNAIAKGFSFARVSSQHGLSFDSQGLDDICTALTTFLGGDELKILEIGHSESNSTIYLAYKKVSELIELF